MKIPATMCRHDDPWHRPDGQTIYRRRGGRHVSALSIVARIDHRGGGGGGCGGGDEGGGGGGVVGGGGGGCTVDAVERFFFFLFLFRR